MHSVSPMKKGKSGTDYYTFSFQTSPDKFAKVIGFDQKTHQQAIHFEKTKSPSKILSAREDDGQIFINQYTSLKWCQFWSMQRAFSCMHFIVSQPPWLICHRYYITTAWQNTNQRVSVKATLTMNSLEPKESNVSMPRWLQHSWELLYFLSFLSMY